MNTQHKFVIGLTGGIGSGKSTVTHLFSDWNVPIIDTDVIAHDLTQNNQKAYHLIIQHFGKNIILKNGLIDRKKLRHIVFQKAAERHWLENMLHPLILDEVQKQLQTISAPYCIVVIPLLFETMLTHTYPISTPYNFLDRILVVDTSVSLQLQRASARDKTEISIIQAIINTQVTREQRLAHAQDVIINDGKLEDLLRQVERLHKKYLTLYSVT